MRTSLRTILILAMAPLTLAAVALGAAILADLAFLQSDLIHLRNGALRSIDIERLGVQLELQLSEAYRIALEDSPNSAPDDALASVESDIAATFERLSEVVAPAEAEGSAARGVLTRGQLAELGERHGEVSRYLNRAIELVREGRGAEARHLIVDEVDVLARAQLRDPLTRIIHAEGAYLDEYSARVNRGGDHWLMQPMSSNPEIRSELLPEVFEAILAERFARYAQSEFREHLSAAASGIPLDPRTTRPLASAAQRALDQLKTLRARRYSVEATPNDDEARAEASLISAYATLRSGFDRSQAQLENRNSLASIRISLDEVLHSQVRVIADANLHSIRERMAELDAFSARIIYACYAIAALGLLIAIGVPTLVSRLVARPVRELNRFLRRVEVGHSEQITLPRGSGEVKELIQNVGNMAAQLEESSRKVRALAFYDTTTGLANRRFFLERLRGSLVAARVGNRVVGLLSISIEGLQMVIDTYGHDAGDDLLRKVADRLGRSVRMSDVISRPGEVKEPVNEVSRMGDGEFNVLLTRVSDGQDASKVADRILGEFFRPFTIERREIAISACIGIGIFPADGSEAEALLRNVTAAMCHARSRGSNHFQFCSEAMNAAAARRQHLRARLAACVERGDLELHFQPLRNTQTGRINAAEALVRWTDSDVGRVPPGEFIPIAEETGLIVQLGEWVLNRAAERIRDWQDRGFEPMRISVNVSPMQLKADNFVEMVSRAITENRLSPGLLELEITETAIMTDDEATSNALSELALMGVSIVLDDFGTGYSSLQYLKRFPIHRLKIDRSFVSEITDEGEGIALCQAILAMAQSLGMPVVAEGVETLPQAEYLQAAGCEEIQGYLISRAVTSQEFERYLVTEKSDDSN